MPEQSVDFKKNYPDPLTDITAVVVTFNSAHCVAALAAQLRDWPHVVVVDNGSADGTAAAVREAMPHAQVIENTRNLGFGTANNQALERAQTPFALLLNPDCAVDAAAARALHATACAYSEAAIVVPQLMAGGERAQLNYGWTRQAWASQGPGAEAPACVPNACGAAMLLRLARGPNIEDAGQENSKTENLKSNHSEQNPRQWFDPAFFLYYEDEDLCLRLFQKRRPIIIDPAVKVAHINRGSVRGPKPLSVEYGRGFHHAQSKILFAAKHQGEKIALALRRKTLLQACALLVLRIFAPSPKQIARLWGRIRGLMCARTRY